MKSDCVGIKQTEVSHRTGQTLSAIKKVLTNYQSVQLFDAVPIFCPSRKVSNLKLIDVNAKIASKLLKTFPVQTQI